MDRKALLESRIIRPCNCNICQLLLDDNEENLIYQILETKYRAMQSFGKTAFWLGCPRSIESTPSSFDELFDRVGDDEKYKIIYHLNSFRVFCDRKLF